MSLGRGWKVIVKIGASILCAGVFYSIWLIVFLLAIRVNNAAIEASLWLLAPIATAAGFATGTVILERLTATGASPFLRVFAWPVTGCVIGAAVVYWFGPMLIVFSMLVAGTVSVILREATIQRRGQ
jgi:hypothetical protein